MSETRTQIVDLCSILRSSRRDLQRAANAIELVETRLDELKRKLAGSGADREPKDRDLGSSEDESTEEIAALWAVRELRKDCDECETD